jgi:predicted RNase H-like nuclease
MNCNESPTFIGVDLGWYGKPSGIAAFRWVDHGLHLSHVTRLQDQQEILSWIAQVAGVVAAVVAVDAAIIIRNKTSIRPAERALNAQFSRFHAGCHPANLARPFANAVLRFSSKLESMGFMLKPAIAAQESGRFQIEVHPHAASVNLFGLPRIVKYKRGKRDQRAAELIRFRALLLERLPQLKPAVPELNLPSVPSVAAGRTGSERCRASGRLPVSAGRIGCESSEETCAAAAASASTS